jgi:hypothetical protein
VGFELEFFFADAPLDCLAYGSCIFEEGCLLAHHLNASAQLVLVGFCSLVEYILCLSQVVGVQPSVLQVTEQQRQVAHYCWAALEHDARLEAI